MVPILVILNTWHFVINNINIFLLLTGYYAVDTSNVMHNMRVVKPAIQDLTEYGIYIAKDCAGFPTYKLEKIVSGGV